MREILIVGGSRGIGDGFSRGLPERGDRVWLVSRGKPRSLDVSDGVERRWLRFDVADDDAAAGVARALEVKALDVLVYNAGVWEATGFSPAYRFEAVPAEETRRVVAVNLTGAIACLQALLPRLRAARGARVVLVGSTSGLPHAATREVAYSASKFGLRGVAHALREVLREDRIPVTCVNPGWVANDVPFEIGAQAALDAHEGRALPVHDVVALVRCVLSLSSAACVKEVDVPAMGDVNA